MTQYRVATYVTVEADDLVEAAKKAFILHDEMTPEEFHIVEVGDEDENYGPSTYRVDLTQEDKGNAREAQRSGKYFKISDLKD